MLKIDNIVSVKSSHGLKINMFITRVWVGVRKMKVVCLRNRGSWVLSINCDKDTNAGDVHRGNGVRVWGTFLLARLFILVLGILARNALGTTNYG